MHWELRSDGGLLFGRLDNTEGMLGHKAATSANGNHVRDKLMGKNKTRRRHPTGVLRCSQAKYDVKQRESTIPASDAGTVRSTAGESLNDVPLLFWCHLDRIGLMGNVRHVLRVGYQKREPRVNSAAVEEPKDVRNVPVEQPQLAK